MGLRVGFMGTPDFAATALRALDQSAHEVVCVYSQPPRPKGRGHKMQSSPVHEYADSQNLPVLTPLNFKDDETRAEFAAHNLDIAIVAAYGLILPEAILSAPKYGCLNIHASLLPRWRGASPIQQAIWAGDEQTGVTIMQMDRGLDTGPMIAKNTMPITGQTTAASLHDDLATNGASLVLEILDRLERDGALKSEEQNDDQRTYAPLLKKEDGIVNWAQNAHRIDCQIRALNPWPGVWSAIGEHRIKILQARSAPDQTVKPVWDKPGTIISRDGHIFCGDTTILKLEKIQPAGKNAMDFAAALNGGYVDVGQIFL